VDYQFILKVKPITTIESVYKWQ